MVDLSSYSYVCRIELCARDYARGMVGMVAMVLA